MLAKVLSSGIVGLDATLIEVEVDIASQGLPSFTIVGLPDKAVEESKERVRSAIRNTGADFPAKRITVNLAPADLPKEGPYYDVPIALGILIASGQVTAPNNKSSIFLGELALDGTLRYINGTLSHTLLAKNKKIQHLYIPSLNTKEATIIDNIVIYPVATLGDLIKHLNNHLLLEPAPTVDINTYLQDIVYEFDMTDIKGQEMAKRALEIAAAGAHNIFMTGEPGAGKTLLARTLPSILPKLTFQEALEVTNIYSISGLLGSEGIITTRPFRSPHHTTSHVGLIGGGTIPKPGEISLAHRGVLFLDELPEFSRSVLEALRQPIEDGAVTVSRSHGRVTFPSKSMIVAAQNPCPCGYYGSTTKECSCMPGQILRYQKKVSGPLLDRIDIHLDIPAVKIEKLTEDETQHSELSLSIRKRVQKARDIQSKRFKDSKIITNSDMTTKDIKKFCPLSPDCQLILKKAAVSMHLSARSYNRIIKLARSIADLEESQEITSSHIAEALQYRPKNTSVV